MNFFLRNQNGVSIVQGLILAGVIAGTSLVTTRLLTDQKLAQKGAQTRDQIEEFHNTISTVLQNRLNCYETMLKNSLHLSLRNSASSHTLTQIWTKDNLVAQTGSLYVNNGVLLKSLSLQAPIGGFRNLEINYERLNTGKGIQTGFGGKNIKKMISLRIQKDPTTSAFSSCYAVSGGQTQLNSTNSSEGNDISKQMCQEMYSGTGQKAFIWDEDNSICKPNAQCPTTQIYVGINSLGEVQCKNIEDWMDFNQVIDTTAKSCPAGSKVAFKIDSVNKKVSINCIITGATPTPSPTSSSTPTPTPTPSPTSTVVAINCDGQWGPCELGCGPSVQTYRIARPASNGGTACPFANGATKSDECYLSSPCDPNPPTYIKSATLTCDTACSEMVAPVPMCTASWDGVEGPVTTCSNMAGSCTNCCKYDIRMRCDYVPSNWVFRTLDASACLRNCLKEPLPNCTSALNNVEQRRIVCEQGTTEWTQAGCTGTHKLRVIKTYRCEFSTPTPTPTPTATVSPTPPLPAKWSPRDDIGSDCITSCSHIELPTCTNSLDGAERNRTTCRTGASGCSNILQEVKQYRCEFD